MTNVDFHPHAADEMNASAAWYEMQRTGLGKRFLAAVQECLQRICINPAMYPEVCPHVHRALVRTFPFAVVYKIEQTQVHVYAVMHMHRDPEYWKRDRLE